MFSAETGQMSAVETRQMSAAETGQMSAVETLMYSIKTGQAPVAIVYICLVSTADMYPVSAADMTAVSTADICPVSTEDIYPVSAVVLPVFRPSKLIVPATVAWSFAKRLQELSSKRTRPHGFMDL